MLGSLEKLRAMIPRGDRQLGWERVVVTNQYAELADLGVNLADRSVDLAAAQAVLLRCTRQLGMVARAIKRQDPMTRRDVEALELCGVVHEVLPVLRLAVIRLFEEEDSSARVSVR